MKKTLSQYNNIICQCRDLFINKTKDYGVVWRILRLPSLTDQIYIKTKRIRNIQKAGEKKINEDETVEFIGIINYCIMALIQIKKGIVEQPDLDDKSALELYDNEVSETLNLMKAKNHDYGEAWRDLRIISITDLIFQKLLRVKQIEENQGKTIVSEGIDANYRDIINYAIFALILIDKKS